jgi:hypothetical protein
MKRCANGRRTHGVEVKYKMLYTLVRTRLQAKIKVSRPRHTKNPDAIAAFQASWHGYLRQAIPSASSPKTKAASVY